jgi:hypothetical protein
MENRRRPLRSAAVNDRGVYEIGNGSSTAGTRLIYCNVHHAFHRLVGMAKSRKAREDAIATMELTGLDAALQLDSTWFELRGARSGAARSSGPAVETRWGSGRWERPGRVQCGR